MPMRVAAAAAAAALLSSSSSTTMMANARLADRSRVVKARGSRRDKNGLAIEGGAYRGRLGSEYNGGAAADDEENNNIAATAEKTQESRRTTVQQQQQEDEGRSLKNPERVPRGKEEESIQKKLRGLSSSTTTKTSTAVVTEEQEGEEQSDSVELLEEEESEYEPPERFSRRLSSQLTGCCYTYQSYSAADMCALYGQDCESGETPSHDSGDESCEQEGLSFIGISFSVNTANGNPYSYQLCDQFPMENIIDRNYDYAMSMDEDGWLVGGGYKSFDYSGKMP